MSLKISELTLDEVLSGVEPLSVTQVPMGSSLNDNGVTWFSQFPFFGVVPMQIKASPGRLYSYYLTSVSASTIFVLLFDSASSPVAGDVPLHVRRALTNTDIFTVLDQFGIYFSRKIWMAISSTAHQYTPITTNPCVVSGNYA